jgi:hypothetical protein
MGAAVAVIVLKERHIVEAFEVAGAIAPHRAVNPRGINVDDGGIAWRRLRDRAIIREASPGMYYVDAEGWQALRRTRRRMATVLMIIVAAVAAVALLQARTHLQ